MGTLRVEDLSLEVSGRRLLTSTSFAVGAGKSLAVVGPSGAGKTSLLNCIAGITAPAAGSVTIDETEVSRLALGPRSEFRLRHIGMVFQFGELLPELSLVENVALPLRLMGENRRVAEQRARVWLDQLDLGRLAGTRPELLSGGELQRGAIARALVHEPSVVLADEPTGMLDEDNTERVAGVLVENSRRVGSALLMATHNPSVAIRADHVMAIRRGRLAEADNAPDSAEMLPS